MSDNIDIMSDNTDIMSDNIDISIWDYVIMTYFIPNQENERSSGVENTIDEMELSMDANYTNYMKPYNLLKNILEKQDKVNKENIYNYLQDIACIILFIHTPIITQYLDIDINLDTIIKDNPPENNYYIDEDASKLSFFIRSISDSIIQNNISIIIKIIYLYIDMIHEYTYIENTHTNATNDTYEIITRIEDSNIDKLRKLLNYFIQQQKKTRYAQMQSYYKTKPHRKNIKEHSSHIFNKLKNSLRNRTRTRTQKIQSTINVRRKNLGTKKYVRFNGGKKNIYPKNKYSKKKYKYLRN